MATAKIVATVQHRETDVLGRRLGHVAYVKTRTAEEMAKYGGLKFASWARLTRDGVETGPAEKFETYASRDAAVRHAEYAAGKLYRRAACGCTLNDIDVIVEACEKRTHIAGQFYPRERRVG